MLSLIYVYFSSGFQIEENEHYRKMISVIFSDIVVFIQNESYVLTSTRAVACVLCSCHKLPYSFIYVLLF